MDDSPLVLLVMILALAVALLTALVGQLAAAVDRAIGECTWNRFRIEKLEHAVTILAAEGEEIEEAEVVEEDEEEPADWWKNN